MKNPINITLDIYNACRTNTGIAATNDGHYNLPSLATSFALYSASSAAVFIPLIFGLFEISTI